MKLTPVTVAVTMTASILCIHLSGVIPAAVAAGCFIVVFVIRLIIKKRAELMLLIFAASIILSGASYIITTSAFMHPSTNYIGKDAKISGTIISNPRSSRTSDNYHYTLRTSGINHDGGAHDMRDTILLMTPERLSLGDRVTAAGTIKSFPAQMNENGFDSALWYRSQNISTRLYSDEIAKSGKGFVLSPYFISQKFGEWIDGIIYRYYYGDTAALISSVLTGNVNGFSDEYYKALLSTALKRQLHPAFIHIWIILALTGLTEKLVRKKYRAAAEAAILAIYAVFTCANIGFARCIVIAAMMIFFRRKDGSACYRDMLAWIFIFCALTMPMILFNVTFIFSSVCGLLISQFSRPISERLTRVPRKLRRPLAILIIIAFIVTPLGTVFFSGICIYALLTPVITVPLVLLIVILSPVIFIMHALFCTAPLLGGIYELAIWILLKLPGFISGLPLSWISTPKPSPAAICLMVSLIFMTYYMLKERKRQIQISFCISLGLLLSLCLSSLCRIGKTEFIFVNVGQGDGAVIHTAYGATVIIDGGGGSAYSDYNIGENIFAPYLSDRGIYNIDAAFISHLHRDHVEGVIAAIEHMHVRTVFYMPPAGEDTEMSEWHSKLKTAAAARGTELCPVLEDTRLCFDGGLTLYVYVPGKILLYDGDENDSSLLIRAEYGRTSALYTGDMSERAEAEYMRRGAMVDADILKVAHHGSATAASDEWTKAVSPDIAVISCGENNVFGHPAPDTLRTLDAVRVLRTDTDGDIAITADRNGIIQTSKFK